MSIPRNKREEAQAKRIAELEATLEWIEDELTFCAPEVHYLKIGRVLERIKEAKASEVE